MFWTSNSKHTQKFLCVLDHPFIMSLIKTFKRVTGFCSLTFTSRCIVGKVWLCWVKDTTDSLSRNQMTHSYYWLMPPTLVICILSLIFVKPVHYSYTALRPSINTGKFSNTKLFCHYQMVQHPDKPSLWWVAYIHAKRLQDTTESELPLGLQYLLQCLSYILQGCKRINRI